MNPGHLFTSPPLYEMLSGRSNQALSEIPRMSPTTILNIPLEDLAEQLLETYRYHVPQFDVDHISHELIPQNLRRCTYKFRVPFVGDSELFLHRPESYWSQFPRAQVEDNYLAFGFALEEYPTADTEAQGEKLARQAEALFEKEFDLVQKFLGEVAKDVEQHHRILGDNIRTRLKEYKLKVQTNRASSSAMKYPLHKRPDAENYVLPLARKPLFVAPTQGKFSTPNAVLEMAKYEDILATLTHMSRAMERNPTVFEELDEEAIRYFFLLMLNAMYEGRATGETFNFGGKTDILIREDDKNIFIAECKFWTGAQGFTEAVNQLIGYISWNDTKTALILFNRNRNFTSVLKQIPQLMQSHPNYKRPGNSFEDETKSQHIFSHSRDPEKELWLTVIAFDVPSKVKD